MYSKERIEQPRYMANQVLKYSNNFTSCLKYFNNMFQQELPVTITDNLRKIDYQLELYRDLSGININVELYFTEDVYSCHAPVEVHRILSEGFDISQVAIRHEKVEPSQENKYSTLKYIIDLHYYKYRR